MVDSLNMHTIGLSNFHVILAKCRVNLSIIPNSKVSFVRRQANQVAHSLARASTFYACNHVLNIVPTCTTSLIRNEIP